VLDEAEEGVWWRLWINKRRLQRYAGRPGYLFRRLAGMAVRAALGRKRWWDLLDGDLADPTCGPDPGSAGVLKEQLERVGHALREVLGTLSERDRGLLKARFASGETLLAIARAEGCSKPRICALLKRASSRFLPRVFSTVPSLRRPEAHPEIEAFLRACFEILALTDGPAHVDRVGPAGGRRATPHAWGGLTLERSVGFISFGNPSGTQTRSPLVTETFPRSGTGRGDWRRQSPEGCERPRTMRARIAKLSAAVPVLAIVAAASSWSQDPDPCPTGMEPPCAGQWSTPINLWTWTPVHPSCFPNPPEMDCPCSFHPPTGGPCREVAHTVLLAGTPAGGPPDGSVLFWRVGPQRPEQAWIWEPGTTSVTTVEVRDYAALRCGVIFCGGHSRLPDGRIVVVDGTRTCTVQSSSPAGCSSNDRLNDYSCADNGPQGTGETWLFDPGLLTGPPNTWQPWRRLDGLTYERWYPGVITMANGDILVAGGLRFGSFCAGTPCTQTTPPGGPGVQGNPVWANSGEVLAWQGFNPQTSQWLPPTGGLQGADSFGTFPHLFLLRNQLTTADVFVASHDGGPYYLVSAGPPPVFAPTNTTNWSWVYSRTTAADSVATDSPLYERSDGTAVAVPGFVDRFALVGGRRAQVPGPLGLEGMADVEDIASPQQGPATATWSPSSFGDLNLRRLLNHTVILPDGTLLTVGGMDREYRGLGLPFTPVLHPERLDPSVPGALWQLMAPAAHVRPYHAGAILLPDGRVLVTGGEFYDPFMGSTTGFVPTAWTFQSDVEIYSPPYLFKGPRPSLLSAPTTPIPYSTPGGAPSLFNVAVMWPQGTTVDRFVLMRPGSATHGVNFEQNYVPLAFQGLPDISIARGWATQTFQLTAPSNDGVPGVSHEAPPGYYMLWVVINQGGPNAGRVPSVAQFVRLL
jgi:galactose oxidase-like protein